MVNSIYNNIHKYDNIDLTQKLFLDTECIYNIYYYNSISAYYNNDRESGYYCCKKLIYNNKNIDETVNNIVFYEENILNDTMEENIKLFYKIDDIIYKKETNIDDNYIKLWEILFLNVKN